MKGRNMARVLISMPEAFLEQIDEIASKEDRSRSELIREAMRRYMKSNTTNPIKAQQNAKTLEGLLS